jgi:hypothetical protein
MVQPAIRSALAAISLEGAAVVALQMEIPQERETTAIQMKPVKTMQATP